MIISTDAKSKGEEEDQQMQSIVGTYVGSISLLQDWTGIGSNPIRPPPLFSYLFLEDGIRPNFA